MALMEDLRTKLTAIGDAIRSKTGGTAGLTMDEMVTAINSISTGGSGGGSSSGGDSGGGSTSAAIENGYTVNFYNSDEVLIQSHSAIYGYWVDAPISYTPDHWEDANAVLHQFPLLVTEDMGIEVVNVYAKGADTYATMLYKHFGVDIGTYPYVAIVNYDSFNSTNIWLIFASSIDIVPVSGQTYFYKMTYTGLYWHGQSSTSYFNGDADAIVAEIINTAKIYPTDSPISGDIQYMEKRDVYSNKVSWTATGYDRWLYDLNTLSASDSGE